MEWPVSYSECGPCEALDSLSDQGKASFESMAAEYLWNWTGRSLGLETVQVRPCRSDCQRNARSLFWGFSSSGMRGVGGSGMMPALIGGAWFNVSCGRCGDKCSCGNSVPSLKMPGPIDSIQQILIDGAVLDNSAYRVDNRQLIVRMDGHRWPLCQNMNLPVTEDDTWQIEYTRGTPVPFGGQIAVGVLACELAKAACNDSSCRLPQRVQTITRQGVTVAVLDPFEGVKEGRTGIWLIDSWVASIMHSPRVSRVYSVDLPRPRNRQESWPTSAPDFYGGGY